MPKNVENNGVWWFPTGQKTITNKGLSGHAAMRAGGDKFRVIFPDA
jgi:hypothetical protein